MKVRNQKNKQKKNPPYVTEIMQDIRKNFPLIIILSYL